MKIISSNLSGKDGASVLQYASSTRENYLSDFVNYWKNHRSVKELRPIERTFGAVLFHVVLKSESGWVTKAILDNNAFFSAAIPVFAGIERWSILVEDDNKSSLLSQLEAVGIVRIDRIEKMEFGKKEGLSQSMSMFGLSPKQLRILRAAVEGGYFDCPRRLDSRELAKQLGIAQSTFLEHLRKSQLKILNRALGSRLQPARHPGQTCHQ